MCSGGWKVMTEEDQSGGRDTVSIGMVFVERDAGRR